MITISYVLTKKDELMNFIDQTVDKFQSDLLTNYSEIFQSDWLTNHSRTEVYKFITDMYNLLSSNKFILYIYHNLFDIPKNKLRYIILKITFLFYVMFDINILKP